MAQLSIFRNSSVHKRLLLTACLLGAAWSTAAIAQKSTDVAPLIIGGQDVPDGKYPFLVGLVWPDENDQFTFANCGGALVAPNLVMTAAHCISNPDIPAQDRHVAIGRTDLKDFSNGKIHKVSRVILHPRFDFLAGPSYDLGFIELAEPVSEPRLVQLPPKGQEPHLRTGEHVTVAGWGWTFDTVPTRLQETMVEVLASASCAAYDNEPEQPYDPSLMLCVGAPGRDSCSGDSGGPLFSLKEDGAVEQLGVVSYGKGCADPQYPGLYTWLGSAELWDTLGESADGLYIKTLLNR